MATGQGLATDRVAPERVGVWGRLVSINASKVLLWVVVGRRQEKKLNFRLLARTKTRYGFPQLSNYTAAGGLEVGQGTSGFLGIWPSEAWGRLHAEAAEGSPSPHLPGWGKQSDLA